eukprot:CAMPEP_0198321220 /NCGR_PEP_ID=MMETSP1450-20131203/9961_1 /TAXON_ID=753684 ORGANISM="Madagascaria erythrocladiodes, Strain CCMP3234" /NCGR_SAMPLE_ID=MMETSP1450 /ASSEMBLY_ACC=CAM_ASM_001115 /LENGTH=1114 /DNA_ID=CAMNT_0044024755 /DNA_START=188 /DNA_END=3529 /DNA_ORIENTATION=-
MASVVALALAALVALAVAPTVRAYHDGTVGARGAHCWRDEQRDTPVACPRDIEVRYVQPIPDTIYAGVEFSAVVTVVCVAGDVVGAACPNPTAQRAACPPQYLAPGANASADVPSAHRYDDLVHANLHACINTGTFDCSPFLTGELVTTTPSINMNFTQQRIERMMLATPGPWRLIYHIETYDGLHYVVGDIRTVLPLPAATTATALSSLVPLPTFHCWQRCGDDDDWQSTEIPCPDDVAIVEFGGGHSSSSSSSSSNGGGGSSSSNGGSSGGGGNLVGPFYAGHRIEMRYRVTATAARVEAYNAAVADAATTEAALTHQNLHACVQRSVDGTIVRCTPFLLGPLVTTSPSKEGSFNSNYTDSITLSTPGAYTLIMHLRTWDGLEIHAQWDPLVVISGTPTATTTTTTTTATTTTATAATTGGSDRETFTISVDAPIATTATTTAVVVGSGVGGGVIAAIVVVVVVVLLILVGGVCFILYRRGGDRGGDTSAYIDKSAVGDHGATAAELEAELARVQQQQQQSTVPIDGGQHPRLFPDTEVSLTRRRVDWNLLNAHAPLDTTLTQVLAVVNNGSYDVWFAVTDIPAARHRFTITFEPSCGLVRAGKARGVRVSVQFFATTRIDASCTVTLRHVEKSIDASAVAAAPVVAQQLLRVQCESELSTRLAWDDFEFDKRSRKLLGSGGFGKVVRAKWRGTDVAVKFISANGAMTADSRNELMRELDVMQQLRHQHVAVFIGACLEPRRVAIVTEFIRGGSVWDLIEAADRTPPPPLLRTKLCLDIAKGLDYMHRSGVWHRDVKPDNAMVVSQNALSQVNVKLIDFGTSRAASHFDTRVHVTQQSTAVRGGSYDGGAASAASMSSVRAGSDGDGSNTRHVTAGVGTPGYIAPEVIAHRPYSMKCDVFSFGITLLEIETCAPAWRGAREFRTADGGSTLGASSGGGGASCGGDSGGDGGGDGGVKSSKSGRRGSGGAKGKQQLVRLPSTRRAEFDQAVVDGRRPDVPRKARAALAELAVECWVAVPSLRPSMADAAGRLASQYRREKRTFKKKQASDAVLVEREAAAIDAQCAADEAAVRSIAALPSAAADEAPPLPVTIAPTSSDVMLVRKRGTSKRAA